MDGVADPCWQTLVLIRRQTTMQHIRCACANGHTNVVKLLSADPSAIDNAAIRCAIINGYSDVVNVLFADPRMVNVHVHLSADVKCELKLSHENGQWGGERN